MSSPPAIESQAHARATSLDNLPASDAAPGATPSDTELVNDILKEINQQQSTSGVGAPGQALNDGQHMQGDATATTSAGLQAQANEAAFARQVDQNINHELAPPTAPHEQLDGEPVAPASEHQAEADIPLSRTLEAASAPESASAGTSTHTSASSGTVTETATESTSSFGLGNLMGRFRFDLFRFVKSFVLGALLFALLTHAKVRTLLCKLPYMSVTAVSTAVDGVATAAQASPPLLSLGGQIALAVVFGVLLGSVQQVV